MNKHQLLIKNAVEARNIKFLLHFTKLFNIESIINNGLLKRDKVLSQFGSKSINDEHRFDDTNGICLSISFPNYKMFYSSQKRNPNDAWIILGIHPSILWEKDCAFYYKNAASSIFRSDSLENRKTYRSFLEMFGNIEKNRKELLIPECFTTNPQAEVIVLEDIPKSYIFSFATPNDFLKTNLEEIFPNEQFELVDKFFSYRNDFSHWKSMEPN